MTRVLFVDDDPVVLRSLARVVRTRGQAWEARYVESGGAAMALLEAEPFDIIVSDLSMPEMDGLTLLGSVRSRFPHITRLALSGQFSHAEGMRAMCVVHQWMAKPCDFRDLCASIERLVWARSLVPDPALLARASALVGLPSPPRLYFQVTEALARGAPMVEVVRLVETDPAVVAKLLQLVNSAFFGSVDRVTSIQRAVAMLGTDTVRGMLLAAEVFRGEAAKELAAHSLLVANLAAKLAPRGFAGDSFLAGILHDLGELIVGDASSNAPELHARAGGLLLGLWGLPSEVVTAIAYHHDPSAAPDPEDETLRALALAEALIVESGAEAARSREEVDPVLAQVEPDQLHAYRALTSELRATARH
ncbi:MAG: HDOD domain-containing protein [Proteobacteria bacterium]|nr:HDOD domain-containing protein [Pseudomonadota bacterium]